MSADLESLKQWIGRTETAVDYVTVPAVNRLSATLDRDDAFPKSAIRCRWAGTRSCSRAWCAIRRSVPTATRRAAIFCRRYRCRGACSPASAPLSSYRCWLAMKVHRESTIQNVTIKDGRSGRMVFVTVKTGIRNSKGVAIVEEQDIVYRGEPDRSSSPSSAPPAQPAPGKAVWKHEVTPDPVMLFRYSALTFNGHRIHYDQPYVTGSRAIPIW